MPRIKSHPPRNASAVNHIKRVHLQTVPWCAADHKPPQLMTYHALLEDSLEVLEPSLCMEEVASQGSMLEDRV